MAILIENMGMPKDGCAVVWVFPDGEAHAYTGNGDRMYNKDCKAIPVPKHGRLIDKDALLEDIDNNWIVTPDGKGNLVEVHGVEKVLAHIAHAPTIIPAEEGEE